LLVRAIEPLLDETTRLVIVGDGPDLPELRTLCTRLARGAFVHLTGARDDVPALLAAFDVFALSSRTEGLPLVVPEAMAVGLPVVATSVGGIPDVIAHEQSGCLVASDDEQALRYWLERLCRDRSKAAEMGWTARAIALGRYSSESMVARYLSLYEDVLERRMASELVRTQAAFT
jgi:glycosyltransferase involved in cell wall biosynthesis